MLSPADMLVVGVAALLFFGPDQLPKVARRAGQVVRDVQATSASFIHEMERAADEPDHRTTYVRPEPYAPEPSTVSIDPASHATIDHEAPATPDHAWQVTADLNPRSPGHLSAHAENGSTEVKPSEATPTEPDSTSSANLPKG